MVLMYEQCVPDTDEPYNNKYRGGPYKQTSLFQQGRTLK